VELTTPTGAKTKYTYDDRGFRTLTQAQWVNPDDPNDVRALTARSFFDNLGRLTNAISAGGLTTSMVYNELDKAVQTVDAHGNSTFTTYDIRGNTIEMRNPDGTISRTVYDPNTLPVVQVPRMVPGQPAYGTVMIYDAVGRAVAVQVWSNVVIAIDATTNGSVISWSSRFVSAGALISSNQTIYDAIGQVTDRIDTLGRTNHYEYDAAGRRIATVDPLGNRMETRYDAAGRTSSMRDPQGREVDFLYDPLGRLTRTVLPDGSSTQTVYDDQANRRSRVDEMGFATDVQYDTAGRVAAMVLPQVADPQNGNTPTRPSYASSFDVYGNLRSVQDAKGRATRFSYDEFNRFHSRTLPGG
jgi:YD repeat-containing protein